MHAEKISEILAHFIGMFDTDSEDLRLRQLRLDGDVPQDGRSDNPDATNDQPPFASDLAPADYEPHLKYPPAGESYDHLQQRLYDQTFHDSLRQLSQLAHADLSTPYQPQAIVLDQLEHWDLYRWHTIYRGETAQDAPLHTDLGTGSEIVHVLQANMLVDDDVLDMTNGHHAAQDLTEVNIQLGQMSAMAQSMSPFSTWDRTDTPDGLIKIQNDAHDFAKGVEQSGGTSEQNADGSHYLVTAANNLDNTYVNGAVTTSPTPVLDDYMPDRGLAKEFQDEQAGTTPLHTTEPTGNSLQIETGANVVANVASITDTNTISPVMAVMGDFHSANVISQVYIYSDNDTVKGLGSDSADLSSAQTIGKNIASFAHSQFDLSSDTLSANSSAIPTAWHVTVVNGDVSFVHWTEQYNFLSDNDSLTVTSSGVDTTILTGGNSVSDFQSFLGLGNQYDLVIVGGHAYNLNAITQISVLYDNDTVNLNGGAANTQVQTGNNLLWNQASIENVGQDNRFTSMPDYIDQTAKNIQDHDNSMPDGLANDPNYAGYQGLNVLYISGNFFDINVIKQVNIVGDADSVTKVASDVLQNNQNATVSIDTGSNAVINLASIVDYGSIGHTTYVAGNVYSDSVLIQGGLVDHHNASDVTAQPTNQLANEAIAFLDNHDSTTSQDSIPDTSHDMSSHAGAVGDVMQSVIA